MTMNYAELTEAYLGRGDLIDALNEQEKTMAEAIDEMDTKIEDLNATIDRVYALGAQWEQARDEHGSQFVALNAVIADLYDALMGPTR